MYVCMYVCMYVMYVVCVYTAGETSALSDDEASGSYLRSRLLPTRSSKVCYCSKLCLSNTLIEHTADLVCNFCLLLIRSVIAEE